MGLINSVSNYQFYLVKQSRRYKSGITNLFHIYLPLVDEWIVYDNTSVLPVVICRNDRVNGLQIKNLALWQILKQLR